MSLLHSSYSILFLSAILSINAIPTRGLSLQLDRHSYHRGFKITARGCAKISRHAEIRTVTDYTLANKLTPSSRMIQQRCNLRQPNTISTPVRLVKWVTSGISLRSYPDSQSLSIPHMPCPG